MAHSLIQWEYEEETAQFIVFIYKKNDICMIKKWWNTDESHVINGIFRTL